MIIIAYFFHKNQHKFLKTQRIAVKTLPKSLKSTEILNFTLENGQKMW